MTITSREEVDISFHDDRRSQLHGTLITFLVITNIVIASRLYVHYRSKYMVRSNVVPEDVFALLSAVCANGYIASLLVATHYGLGLHGATINAHDPHMPRNLAELFKYVWITMVLQGPTLSFIKLSLLFLYRRLFLVHQKWLRIAWWANLIYIILWFFGSTGFYMFQCLPVGWYWKRYYRKFDPTYTAEGQCNATKVENVAIPLIFGLISDVALLCLPIFAILGLRISTSKKLGLAGVFGIGAIACILEAARTVQLFLATDDKTDPSYGVAIFLILSAAEVVCALMCSSLPVVAPLLWRQWENRNRKRSTPSRSLSHSSRLTDFNNRLSTVVQPSRILNRGFDKLEDEGDVSINLRTALRGDMGLAQGAEGEAWPLKKISPTYSAVAATPAKREGIMSDQRDILVQREVRITAERDERGHDHGGRMV